MNATATATATATAIKTMIVPYIHNNFTASMKGCCKVVFAALPDGEGGYKPCVRADKLDGAIVLSTADVGVRGLPSASARHAKAEVEVDLPVGTILKTVNTACTANGYKGTVIEVLRDNGELDEVRFVGNKKVGENWQTVCEIDGQRVILK